MIHEAKLTNIAEELSAASQAVWGAHIDPGTEDRRERAHLWRQDGLRIILRETEDRLRISWDLHAPEYKVNGQGYGHQAKRYDDPGYPEIACSPAKTSKQIAGDIRRRLLPEAEKLHRRALDIAQGHRIKLSETIEFIERLNAAGFDTGPHNFEREKWCARGKDWDLYIGPWTRELKLHRLDDNQILAVIDALEKTPKTEAAA